MKSHLIFKALLLNSSLYIPLEVSFLQNIYTLDVNNILTYDSVRMLAIMSYDVYFHKNSTQWWDVKLNTTVDLSRTEDSVHAYLFSDENYNTNVVAFKGTTIYWDTPNLYFTPRVTTDKLNDNLYFSCCYYAESSIFDKDDCICTETPGSCDLSPFQKSCYKTCYRNSTNFEWNYLNISKTIVESVVNFIPQDKEITLFTGHSLGGFLSTMMGIVYNKHVVTFESPGGKHYLDLVGLDYTEKQLDNIYHFGHNADPVFTGRCNGIFSWCYLGGYIMNTKCHIGNVCEYDSIGKLNMKESIYRHRIKDVITQVIEQWNETLPECEQRRNCIDCDEWTFV